MIPILRLLLVLAVMAASSGFAVWQATRLDAALAPGEAAASGRPGRPGRRAEPGAAEVALATTALSPVTPVSTAYGRVVAPRTVEIAPAVTGRVAWVAEGLRDGARVAAGEQLLRIDDSTARTALAEAQATRAAAETALTDARRRIGELEAEMALLEEVAALRAANLERVGALAQSGGVAASTRDDAAAQALGARQSVAAQAAQIAAAESEVRQGEIVLEQAGLAVERAERTLEDHELHALIGGLYTGAVPVAGQSVTTAALGQITDLDALEVRAEPTRSTLARLSDETGALLPLPAEIEAPGGGLAQGRLDRLSLETGNDGTTRGIAVLRVEAGGCACLQPGDFVELRIEEPSHEAVAVPHDALSADDTLLVVDETGQLDRVTVEVERRTPDAAILTPDGAGLRYVVAPTPELIAGGRIALPETEERVESPDEAEMVDLDPPTRARLMARLEAGEGLPAPLRARIESALETGAAPAAMLERLDRVSEN
jgi:multidrug efflux pump subunit AcrA (membrane-fusion protein)